MTASGFPGTTPGISAALALAAALSFGLYTVAIERGMARAGADREGSPVLAAVVVSTVIAVAAFWALAVARGLPRDALTPPKVAPFVIAGIAYPALFRLLYFEAIDRVGASVSAAILGIQPAVAALLAVAALGERSTVFDAGGILLIVVGVGLLQLTRQDGGVRDVVSEKLAAADPADFAYPAVAVLTVGGAYVLIKFGLDRFPDPVTATAITQTPALVVFGGWALSSADARTQLRLRRAVLAVFVVAGVFNVAGWLSQFFALRLGTVVTVVPLLNTYPLVVMGISYALARQVPRSPRLLAAVLAIVAGATLVQVT